MAWYLGTVCLVLVAKVAASSSNAQIPRVPQLNPNDWWGPPATKGKTNSTIRPFKCVFSQEMITDLKRRLRSTRELTPPLEGIAFEYGFNSKQVQPWVKYWSEEYDFQERENFFNKFPQYKTNIQGLDMHFIWIKPQVNTGVTVLPLLLLHGWPGCVLEFYGAIPLLTTPRDGVVFEVVVPSLPGFGFSNGAVRPGMGSAQMAVIFLNLMKRLGHDKFYVQGGDFGSNIAKNMATLFPKAVLGYHSNWLSVMNACIELKSSFRVMAASQSKTPPTDGFVGGFSYLHLQATKPDTLGMALSDSPVALLAYILEKFSIGTRQANLHLSDGGLFDRLSKDQLIDNLMMYWVTNSITTSMRLYAETFSLAHRELKMDELSTSVPCWNLQAKHEPLDHIPSKLKYPNLLGITVLDDGGHFLALELPEPFAADVFKAVRAFREFHGARTEL